MRNFKRQNFNRNWGGKYEQNIYFSYLFDNNIEQTVIDINKMLDYDLFNLCNRNCLI